MNDFFSNNDKEYNEKINLDDLYERKHEIELNRMSIYNKILGRVHSKIKLAARQKNNHEFTFYIIPEFIFGIPKYNVDTCISYIIDKLQENGFLVKYTHPNLLYIYWGHYIPSYKRTQIKKETGQSIDGFGNIIVNKNKEPEEDINNMLIKKNNNEINENKSILKNKTYKDISSYKPQGIYNIDLISKIKDKLS
jgi:hypothetical protein